MGKEAQKAYGKILPSATREDAVSQGCEHLGAPTGQGLDEEKERRTLLTLLPQSSLTVLSPPLHVHARLVLFELDCGVGVGSMNFLCKGPGSQCFWLCGMHGLLQLLNSAIVAQNYS